MLKFLRLFLHGSLRSAAAFFHAYFYTGCSGPFFEPRIFCAYLFTLVSCRSYELRRLCWIGKLKIRVGLAASEVIASRQCYCHACFFTLKDFSLAGFSCLSLHSSMGEFAAFLRLFLHTLIVSKTEFLRLSFHASLKSYSIFHA